MPVTVPRRAFLTIDDAPSPATRGKLAVLEERGIKALWFCRGKLIEARPGDAASIIEHGHVIGNHSFDHPRFSTLSFDACIDQVARTEAAIERVHVNAGIQRRARMFRFPFGDKGDGFDDPARRPETMFPHAVALQRYLHAAGFRCPAFPGVSWPWYVQGGYGTDADTYFTWDPGEWRLLSKSAKHRHVTLASVLDGVATRDVTPSAEIVVVHDFEAIAGAFLPLLDAIEALGFTLAFPPGL